MTLNDLVRRAAVNDGDGTGTNRTSTAASQSTVGTTVPVSATTQESASSATTQLPASSAQSSSTPTTSQTPRSITSISTSQTFTTTSSSSTTFTSSTSSSTSTGIATKPFAATGVTTGPGLAQTSSFANVAPASKGNTPVGAIVGGVLGLLLLLLGIFYYRKRRLQGFASEAPGVKPFMIPEHQNHNVIQLPSSLGAHQSSFAIAMSKNTAPRITIQQMDCRPIGAVGKREAASHQTSAAVLAPHPQQGTSTTMITNPASDPPASVPDPPSRVFIHQDSGIRLPEQGPDVVEYPPIYTPG